MAIYTQSTMDFDASSAIQSQYQAGVGPIVQPYITAGFTEPIPTWTPPLPDGTYPAPSGQYQNHRSWTDPQPPAPKAPAPVHQRVEPMLETSPPPPVAAGFNGKAAPPAAPQPELYKSPALPIELLRRSKFVLDLV